MSKKRIYLVETMSVFRHRYLVEDVCEFAADSVVLNAGAEPPQEEWQQKHLSEDIFSIREISDTEMREMHKSNDGNPWLPLNDSFGDVIMERSPDEDLKENAYACRKIADSELFAQHVYAAMCNQQYYQHGVDQTTTDAWSFTWRYAGEVIADIRNTHLHEKENSDIREDYLHWYCSGMGMLVGAVSEGVVTDEVRHIFYTMGWDIVAYPSEWGV